MGRWAPLTLVTIVGLACGESSEPAVPIGNAAGGSGGASNVTTGSGGNLAGASSSDAAANDEPRPEAGPLVRDAADVTVGAVDVGSTDVGAPITSDASASDAPSGTDGPSLPCPTGALLCEDFDEYATAADLASGWKVTTSGATLAVDTTKPFGSGGKALHVVAPAGTPTAVIVKEGAPLFPIAGDVIFGRVMIWLTQTPGGNYHWNNFQAAGTITASMRNGKYGWGGQAGKVLAGYTVRSDPAGTILMDCSKPSATALPEKRWSCVEWKFDGVANEMHYWFDGALLADVDVIGKGTRCVNAGDLGTTWQAPTFANLSVGWQQYQASSGPLELWMDDLVVSTQRIGCPAP